MSQDIAHRAPTDVAARATDLTHRTPSAVAPTRPGVPVVDVDVHPAARRSSGSRSSGAGWGATASHPAVTVETVQLGPDVATLRRIVGATAVAAVLVPVIWWVLGPAWVVGVGTVLVVAAMWLDARSGARERAANRRLYAAAGIESPPPAGHRTARSHPLTVGTRWTVRVTMAAWRRALTSSTAPRSGRAGSSTSRTSRAARALSSSCAPAVASRRSGVSVTSRRALPARSGRTRT